jgi:CheY-like chemotaxis protein
MRARILVVDNDPCVLELLEAILSSEGYDVEARMDPEDVLRKLAANPPDLLVSDIMMPAMTGMELLGRSRSQGYWGPFILMSALATSSVAETADSSGADAFFTKPLQTADFLVCVERLTGNRKSNDERRQGSLTASTRG